MNIGFIGLGIMGRPMVKNLLQHGHEVFVNDVNVEAMDRVVDYGAFPVETLEDMAKESEVIITMLPNGQIVDSVLFSVTNGIAKYMSPGQMVIDMSSLGPDESIAISKKLETLDIRFADAPVSGGEPLAITGELSVMVGCNTEDFEYLKEVISPMAASVVRVGDIGGGSTVKLANQIIVNVNIAALSEAVVLAKKFNINLEKMHEAIGGGLAGSNVMEAKFPKMINEDYTPGGPININYKDLKNVTDTTDAVELTLPVTNMVKEIYKAEKAAGNGMNDHSGIIKYFEKINDM